MKKQRQIAKAIKRSRAFGTIAYPLYTDSFICFVGYMPYTYKLPEYLNDPKLF